MFFVCFDPFGLATQRQCYGKKDPKLLGILSFIEFCSKNKSVTTLFKHGCTARQGTRKYCFGVSL